MVAPGSGCSCELNAVPAQREVAFEPAERHRLVPEKDDGAAVLVEEGVAQDDAPECARRDAACGGTVARRVVVGGQEQVSQSGLHVREQLTKGGHAESVCYGLSGRPLQLERIE